MLPGKLGTTRRAPYIDMKRTSSTSPAVREEMTGMLILCLGEVECERLFFSDRPAVSISSKDCRIDPVKGNYEQAQRPVCEG
jgi:hypothetical protein